MMRLLRLAIGMSLLTAVAAAQSTTRVSVKSAGGQGNDDSANPAVSADGQVVAFLSNASNLVAGDTNGTYDVFVRDRATGLTERVSVDSAGVEGNGTSSAPVGISADGQVVAFYSFASNLVPGDTNALLDIFVHDRTTGITERVSVDSAGAQANSESFGPTISADGRIVSFSSYASNLVAGDTNGVYDVFIHDRVTGITERVSVDSAGAEGNQDSFYSATSADGQIVAFSSLATNLDGVDTNADFDVFVHDRATGLTERVSVDSAGAEGNGASYVTAISADGQVVVFTGPASNLVPGDTNGTFDAFAHDRATAVTERVSVSSAGVEGNADSDAPVISADGLRVLFVSRASNLVVGDTNAKRDVFVHDRATGLTERVSVDSAGAQGNDASQTPAISADGESMAFSSDATNLVAGDTNGDTDVFVHHHCGDATWSNYGVGFAGTNGIPTFTSQVDPVLGTTVTLDLGSSSSAASVAFVLIGYSQTLVPTSKGGDLLVAPAFTMVLPLPTTGTTIVGDLPDDEALCGFELFAQALELDAGAARGVSFTAGLQLVLGR